VVREQTAEHADVGLKHRHVEVACEAHIARHASHGTLKLGAPVQYGQRVDGVEQRQRTRHPRVVPDARQRLQLVGRIRVSHVRVVRPVEHAGDACAQPLLLDARHALASTQHGRHGDDDAKENHDEMCRPRQHSSSVSARAHTHTHS
jgi:hypothetical protein